MTKKLRVLQMGIGDYGKKWLEVLKGCNRIEITGVVSRNIKHYDWVCATAGLTRAQIFIELETALDVLKPDCLLITTPPAVHCTATLAALKRKIAVLCEKPISDKWNSALCMLTASQEWDTPLIITENYRYFPVIRRAKQLIEEGKIGTLDHIELDFARHHEMKNYHSKLTHPMLLDLGVHHFDCIRYITDLQPLEIFCQEWKPSWSWYEYNPSCYANLLLEKGIYVSYRGTLCSRSNETSWLGKWQIVGSLGEIIIADDELKLVNEFESCSEVLPDCDGSMSVLLEEAADCILGRRCAPTDIKDNMKSFATVIAAIKSAETNMPVKL